MSPDHAITPEMIHRELVRLTDTEGRVSKVVVQPARDALGFEVAQIAFECDDVAVGITVLPMHLLYSLDEFSAMALQPLARFWQDAAPDAIAEAA